MSAYEVGSGIGCDALLPPLLWLPLFEPPDEMAEVVV